MITPEQQEHFNMVRQFYVHMPHCIETDMTVLDISPGAGAMRIGYDERMVGNPETRYLHGGVLTALLDTTSSIAALAADTDIKMVATLDLRIDYLKPSPAGEEIIAIAECYKCTQHVAFIRGYAYNGTPNNKFATSQATFMITDRKSISGEVPAS